MKTYSVQFAIAGTRQLRSGTFSGKNETSIATYITVKYGYCDYLIIKEL